MGVLALSGASGYTGVTKVFQGALAISHGAALGASSGSTVVSAGAALRIAGDITSAEPLSSPAPAWPARVCSAISRAPTP